MQFTPTEAKSLTTFTPLTRTELEAREREGGFTATLEDLARADAQAEKPRGQEWWLEQIMGPLRDQDPALSDYDLAKAENEARRGLGMPPNADTLFTQYLQEELEKMNVSGEISDDMMAKIIEKVQQRVQAEIQEWHEAQQKRQQDSTENQELAQFDVMIEDLTAAIHSQLPGGGLLTSQGAQDTEIKIDVLEAQSVLDRPDADTLLEQIRAAQNNPVAWQTNA